MNVFGGGNSSMQQHGGGGSAESGQNKPKTVSMPGGKPPIISSKYWALFDVN